MIDCKKIEIFKNNFCKLKDTSKDDPDGHVVYMTESQLDAINFDTVKDQYVEGLHLKETPRSNDCLYICGDGTLVFIEFKNGKIDKEKIYEIRLKIFDSLLILTDIIQKGISVTRFNMDYILVYNEVKNPIEEPSPTRILESESRTRIGKAFWGYKAKKKLIRFNLERFEKLYFREVFTYTEKEFESLFVSKYTV